MAIATLTSKGQTTVAREIREHLKLECGDRLHFTVLPNGTVVMRAKKRDVRSLAGMLKVPGRPSVSIALMNRAIADVAAQRANAPTTIRRGKKRR
jgi:bifunctional DNA-binding transcriptional regulator/antitoxin component of YhaV-PrlF toxin-antitoxin module